jgi:vacuolar-type H+-ATPase subunit F/Vma7
MMTSEREPAHPTRLLFLGETGLAEGFRLIGFETHPDPSPAEAERIIRELSHTRERAFLIVDDRLMAADIPSLKRVRREGGRVLVISVPPLNAPPRLASEVTDRVSALFGAAALQPGTTDSPGSA